MSAAVPVTHVEPIEFDFELVTGEAVTLDLRPAGFIVRAAGAIIDVIVYFGGFIIVSTVIFVPLLDALGANQAVSTALSIALLVLFVIVVPMTVETLSRGKSLGRLALGTRIMRDDGGAIGFRHAFIRALAGFLDFYLTLGGAATVSGLLTARTKRVGDLLAGTYSQYERIADTVKSVYGVPVELQQWALTADVARMPDRLHRRIAQYLAQAANLTWQTRDRLARELATEASPYVSPLPQVNAELFLAAVAALRREREARALEIQKSGLERLEPALRGLPHGFPRRDAE